MWVATSPNTVMSHETLMQEKIEEFQKSGSMEGIRSHSPEMSSIIVLRGPHPNQTLQCSRNPKNPNPGTSRSMNAQNIPNMQNSGSMEGVRGHCPEIAEFLQFFRNGSIFSSPNIPCSTTKCGSWWMRVSISIYLSTVLDDTEPSKYNDTSKRGGRPA